MANVNVTSNAWTEISITSGTVQNISATADIELSAEQTDNSGVVLHPSEIYQWDNETIYARAVTEDTGALRVVNFKKAAGGGGGYVLPVASASTLGGVKVGNNLSIDASGVLSATGGGGGYVLPPATASTLGGVIIGDNVNVDANGEISVAAPYSLPKAAAGTLGGVKIGSNVNVDGDGVISVAAPYSLPTAAADTLGGVKIGDNITIDANGAISATAAYTLPPATASTLGGVIIGDNISVDANGEISTHAPYSLPAATANDLGGVKVGSNVSIDGNGVISVAAPYSLPAASANTLGGIKVGNNLSIDENGVLSSTGGGGSPVDIKKTVAAAPAYYEREQLYNTNQTTITIYPTWVNIDDSGFILETTKLLDIENADNWDDGQYTTAANRAGKDFYIYACKSSGNAPDFILSANSTIPTGYTATNSRKIGGFHCLCVAVGTISGHTLSGYLAGDILPQSPWDLIHRATSENEGMVYIPEVNKWVDIYLASYDGAKLVSAYNGIIADGESNPNFHGEKFVEYFGLVNKKLPARDDFMVFAKGSNEGTNISGSADPNTTGGHVDTNSRRMISNYGLEDCCGALWQWTNDCPENYLGSTWNASSTPYWMGGYAWQTNPVYNPNCDTQSYGSCSGLLRRLVVGGSWGASSYCGSRCVDAGYFGSCLGEAIASRGCSNSRI